MMKVEEALVPQVNSKRRQGHYLPKKHGHDQQHRVQLKIDDYLLKKKKRSNENDLIGGNCPKKAKMMLNPFNKLNSYYLFNSSLDHCSSNHSNNNNNNNNHSKPITNQTNLQNNQNKINSHKDAIGFNRKTGLPLSSSPIPQHKSSFSFERSIKSTNAIKRAILNKEPETDENFNLVLKKPVRSSVFKNLLGNFEENLLNGRFNAIQTIHGKFRAEIGTSGKLYNNFFCPDHLKMPVTVYFYNIHELGNIYASPYLAKVNLEKKGYLVPRKGNVQVTLFNPEDNIVKMFVVQYDLSDMPSNSQSFIRQKTYYMPKSLNTSDTSKSAVSNNNRLPNCQQQMNGESSRSSNHRASSTKDENQSANIQSNENLSHSSPPSSNLSLSTTDLTANLPNNLTNNNNTATKSYTSTDEELCKFDLKTSWLRYLIHLRFISTKSGKIYLHRDIRILILRKNEFDRGSLTGLPTYHWVTEQITEQANNTHSSKYSLR